MAAAYMTTTAAATSSRVFLPPFEGLRPTTIKVSSVSFRRGRALTIGSTRRLLVKAATSVAPKYTTLKPLGDRVLVKISAAEEKTSGGILLPSTAQSKPQGGEVVAVGEGRTVGQQKVDVSVKTGTQVVYSKYAGTEVEFNGSNHLLLKEDDIIGILETDDVKDLKPLNDRVLIKITEAEETTAGGLLLTQSSKEKPSTGTVIAVGPGPLGEDGSRKELTVSAGNTVLYSKFAGNDFKGSDGSEYIVLRASDIMAVIA
ncbi:hypothetical protein M8C21_030680 [Ambrosia artemisiifolia]|uniref:20 kDa chaperonin, chloroplastic n=1 Tax=Ambrosia artemisiifolia TaxID=4212 RepID=A0AAD5C3S8_AMBAR|nr:hypothetical protein M8C21_030680 [Ambrosia artemisiifolia]